MSAQRRSGCRDARRRRSAPPTGRAAGFQPPGQPQLWLRAAGRRRLRRAIAAALMTQEADESPLMLDFRRCGVAGIASRAAGRPSISLSGCFRAAARR